MDLGSSYSSARKIERASELGSFVSLVSYPVACDGSPTTIVEEEALATGGTVLRFDSGQFIYIWQTSNAWSGCRVLQLSLADGSQHHLKFNFR